MFVCRGKLLFSQSQKELTPTSCAALSTIGMTMAFITVLRKCRSAMAREGKILIVDMIVPETESASFSKLLDLNMMVMTGGRERTISEFQALLDAADCQLTRTIPTMAPQSIIEATAR